MEQLDILKHARSTDPQTSTDAAASVNLGLQCTKTLEGLKAYGDSGATASQVVAMLTFEGEGPQQSVIARRLTDLEERCLIERTGETRKGPSGRQLTVWRAL